LSFIQLLDDHEIFQTLMIDSNFNETDYRLQLDSSFFKTSDYDQKLFVIDLIITFDQR
jgi:hypothetical protein